MNFFSNFIILWGIPNILPLLIFQLTNNSQKWVKQNLTLKTLKKTVQFVKIMTDWNPEKGQIFVFYKCNNKISFQILKRTILRNYRIRNKMICWYVVFLKSTSRNHRLYHLIQSYKKGLKNHSNGLRKFKFWPPRGEKMWTVDP